MLDDVGEISGVKGVAIIHNFCGAGIVAKIFFLFFNAAAPEGRSGAGRQCLVNSL